MKLTNESKLNIFWNLVQNFDYLDYSIAKKETEIKKSNFERIVRVLTKRGYLIKIKRGTYIPKNSNINEYSLANLLFGGYIGFESALYLHKLIDIIPFEIYSINSKSSKSYKFRNYTLIGFQAKNLSGVEYINKVLVSTKAKTIYDCIKYNRSTKNTIINSIEQFTKNETKEFLEYIRNESNSFKQKLGFILEEFSKKNNQTIKLIDYCSRFIKNKVYINKNGRYNKKWRVIY